VSRRYLIGLDAGTTAIKGVLIDDRGAVLASAGKEYNLQYPAAGHCEVDPEVYWNGTCQVIKALLEICGRGSKEIEGLAFSSQGETLICVDKNGKPLRNAIVWLDNRSVDEAEQIRREFGEEKVLQLCGQPEIVPTWTASRITWLREHEPPVFQRVDKFQLVEDHLVSRLTGKYFTNACMSSSTLYLDIHRQRWWKDMLDYLGIGEERLPGILEPGQVVGELTDEAVRQTGLDKSVRVISGAYDHAAGAVGAGNIYPGMVTETTGTSMAMVVTLEKPVLNKTLNLPCHCHAVPGKYYLLPYGQTAGMLLRWFRDTFCQEEILKAEAGNMDPYELMTRQAIDIPPGSEGLVILPHLMGAGSPEFDARVKGTFAGITPGMRKGHFIRAMMESVACMVRRNLEAMKESGISVKQIRALGGGSVSNLWNQIKADMTGIPYQTVQTPEAACTGAAILAGAGSGVFRDISDGCNRLVSLRQAFLPDRGHHDTYTQVFRDYVKLYDHLKNYW
jgi:D-xylulose kinase